jgi:serine/threonine protein kinase
MPLAPGHRLGVYQIVETLGAGGMGEVYRARDTSLHREVAIKVLPDLFAGDPDRLQRLTREARALAALNHPNIAHVHGLDDTGSGRALVMELVEGEDLSRRIARGALPLADTVAIARQIADALEAAHEQGLVHRDLKPANIKIRPDGTVKVLDFGLATTVQRAADTHATGGAPTMTAAGSEHGLIVGSAPYMAPEQARGQTVDKRADIWAFGAVLYEMLTGARAFPGEAVPDVFAAILRREIDWSRLPAGTPAAVRRLLERCLTIDVRQRLRDIGEARVMLTALERGESAPEPDATPVRRDTRWRARLALALAALATAAALFVLIRIRDREPAASVRGVSRLSVVAPPGLRLNLDSSNATISPDGRSIAVVTGTGIAAENQLWVRSLGSPVARRIDSADGVSLPFWSPDSTRIAFFAQRKLKVVSAAGGPAEVICDAPFGRGGSWNRANVIVFAPDAQGPLHRVAATGGTPAPLTTLDRARAQQGHRFPFFLPDGDRFLFAAIPARNGAFDVFAGSLQAPSSVTFVGSFDSAPAFIEPDWLLFARQSVVAVQHVDPKTLKATSDPISLGDQPGVAPSPAAYEAGPRLSVAADGSFAYYLPAAAEARLQWMDAAGRPGGIVGVPAGAYTHVAIAPDGARAVLVRDDSGGASSLWLVDLARAGAIPLAADGHNHSPVWSPDGRQIVFASDRGGPRAFFVKDVTGTSPERKLLEFDDRSAEPRGWSSDGSWIMFNRVDPDTRWNVYRLSATASRPTPEVIVTGPSVEMGARTSPDSHWLAYLSDETGRLDLFVRSAIPSGPKVQVSTGGVQFGWWARDARHMLFTRRDQTLWRTPIELGAETVRVGAAQQVGTLVPGIISMDLAPDGRFLALVAERSEAGSITVVQSWQSALPLPR